MTHRDVSNAEDEDENRIEFSKPWIETNERGGFEVIKIQKYMDMLLKETRAHIVCAYMHMYMYLYTNQDFMDVMETKSNEFVVGLHKHRSSFSHTQYSRFISTAQRVEDRQQMILLCSASDCSG